ncbi:hypothetical protein [Nonomuraea roseola]|uniref:Uncharacterized protein n=1 Tax=Nonomuraea roseola TaxID=46179 RepID=A0ABV5PTD3_9ACTN
MAASASAQAAPSARGTVVSATQVEKLDKKQVAERLKAAGLDPAQATHGVRAYRVVYTTIDPYGRPTTASQLVALPDNGKRNLRVVSWLHGTTVYRGDVASMNPAATDRAAALLFASTGQAVSAPDIAADRFTGIYDASAEAFREPYDKQVEELFDGDHKPQEIAQALPPTWAKLFTEEFLQKVREPTGSSSSCSPRSTPPATGSRPCRCTSSTARATPTSPSTTRCTASGS